MSQTFSIVLVFVLAMGIGPAIGFIYLGVSLLVGYSKKFLTD